MERKLGSLSQPADAQPSARESDFTLGLFPSSESGSASTLEAENTASAVPAEAASNTRAAAPEPYSKFTCSDPSYYKLPSSFPSSHFVPKTAQEGLNAERTYKSSIASNPRTTSGLYSRPRPGAGGHLRQDRASETDPDLWIDPKLSHSAETVSSYDPCSPCHYWDPQKESAWKDLPVSEPGTRGLGKPEVGGRCEGSNKTLPRGHCLLYNWEEERATNHLDQVPCMQYGGSESFFFRHGHHGLLTLQPQLPMPVSTTQKDSYQPPRNCDRPIRGKREAMMEILLSHQICKEVLAEQEPTRELFELESVTQRDYRKELVQAGPPAPTKCHDYRQEQPETFWIQRAPQLPGVSYIRTLDTPFRRNCSFSTPVPLSLGQPLPYEPEEYYHQFGETSSLACHGEGQGRTSPM